MHPRLLAVPAFAVVAVPAAVLVGTGPGAPPVAHLEPLREDAVPRAGRPRRLPLAFEENRGQFDPAVRFLARTGAGGVFVADGEIVFTGGPRPVRMRPVGGAIG